MKFKINAIIATVAVVFALSGTVHAQQVTMPSSQSEEAKASSPDFADAEVRKVDKEGKRITLKHGEIKNLNMPGMTMVFTVKDGALLDTIKSGDKVQFKAIDDGGKLTVVVIKVTQ